MASTLHRTRSNSSADQWSDETLQLGLDRRNDWPSRPPPAKRSSRRLTRFLITFCIGVAATLAWQSYGDAAREMIANSYPQLGWLAPQAEPVAQNAPDGITSNMATSQEQITRSMDRIASRVAANQDQLTRSIDQLAVSQEWLTREITKLEEMEQSIRHRNSEPLPPPPRSASASAPKPVTRPASTSALAPKP